MRSRYQWLIERAPLILRVVVVAAALAAMAAGLAAPDDWGYSGWIPKVRK